MEVDDVLNDNHITYMLCIPYWRIKLLDSLDTETASEVKREPKNVSTKEFLNYSFTSIEHTLKTRYNVTELRLFKLNESYLFNEHVCFRKTNWKKIAP